MAGYSIDPFPWPGGDPPPARQLAQHVHRLSAADTLNVRMDEPHFRERMLQRGVDIRSVLEVLREGRAVGNAEQDDYGAWRIEMSRRVAGRRVHVAVAVYEDHVVCITTWV